MAARGGDGVQAIVTEHVRHKGGFPENFCKLSITDAEAAGIGPEGRHHRALAVAGKTAPLHPAAAGGDARLRMQMAGDFADRSGRLMSKDDRPDRDFARHDAAETVGQRRIVIAQNPDPVALSLEGRDSLTIRRRKPVMRLAIMEAVAKRNHCAWIVPEDDGRQTA